MPQLLTCLTSSTRMRGTGGGRHMFWFVQRGAKPTDLAGSQVNWVLVSIHSNTHSSQCGCVCVWKNSPCDSRKEDSRKELSSSPATGIYDSIVVWPVFLLHLSSLIIVFLRCWQMGHYVAQAGVESRALVLKRKTMRRGREEAGNDTARPTYISDSWLSEGQGRHAGGSIRGAGVK